MKITIGRSDKADFPELFLENIDVKIDSGAYTSSIHCTNIKEVVINGETLLQFTVLDAEHSLYHPKKFTYKDYTSKEVKSSNGVSETRFMIYSKIVIFNTTYPIYLTLSERKNMKYPVLLGRKFLNNKFVIDTVKKELSYKLKNINR
jgi:hypothetical protein